MSLPEYAVIDIFQNLLEWQTGDEFLSNQRCFILNFGYQKSLPFPQLHFLIEPESKSHFNVGTFGLNSPNKCSIVVIGGKYLERVDEVMKMVDKITEDIAWMPSAVFLMAEKPGQNIQINVSTRHRRSPTMYQVPATQLHLHPPQEGQWGGG